MLTNLVLTSNTKASVVLNISVLNWTLYYVINFHMKDLAVKRLNRFRSIRKLSFNRISVRLKSLLVWFIQLSSGVLVHCLSFLVLVEQQMVWITVYLMSLALELEKAQDYIRVFECSWFYSANPLLLSLLSKLSCCVAMAFFTSCGGKLCKSI